MFGCYRRGDANDPDTYVAAIAAVLADYPADVIQSVTDPRTGLPSKSDWPPTVREVKSACEDIEGPRRRAREWERGAQEQLKSRALPPPTRPTLEELKEKYGPNWGIGQATKGDDERKQARSDMMRAANKTVFERECKAAGVDPAHMTVSPSLAKVLHTDAATVEARMRKAEAIGRQADKLAAEQNA